MKNDGFFSPVASSVHQLRTQQDAVLVGKNIWESADCPAARVVKRSTVEDCPDEKLPQAAYFQISMFFASTIQMKSILKNGDSSALLILPVKDKNGELTFGTFGKTEVWITRLFVEGGGELAWSLIKSVVWTTRSGFWRPRFWGRDEKPQLGTGRGTDRRMDLLWKKLQIRTGFYFQGKIEKR